MQFRINAVARGEISEGLDWTLDGSLRWREEARGDEQQTVRVTLRQDIDDGVRIAGGLFVLETEGGRTEIRTFEDLLLSRGRWSSRTRIEQRFVEGSARMELRFRQRLRYRQPVAQDWDIAVDGELFQIISARDPDRGRAKNQWRARAFVLHDVSDDLSVGAGYMLVYVPRPDARDRISHVPQLRFSRRF